MSETTILLPPNPNQYPTTCATFTNWANDRLRYTGPAFPSGNFTLMFWGRFNEIPGLFKSLFYRCNNAGVPYLFWGTNQTAGFVHYLDANLNTTNVSSSDGVSGSTLTVSKWYHFCLTHVGQTNQPTTGRAYINGHLDITSTSGGNDYAVTNDMLMLGSDDDTDQDPGHCSIAAVKIWDGLVMTASEIQQEMIQTEPVIKTKLWCFLPMTPNTITKNKVLDLSGRNNHWTRGGTNGVTF